MRLPYVYLAGTNSDEATSFRDECKREWSSLITFIDPFDVNVPNHLMVPVDVVIDMDLKMIESSDFVLAFCNYFTMGTCSEIFYASKILGKKVYIVYSDEDSRIDECMWLSNLAEDFFHISNLGSVVNTILEKYNNGRK